MMVVEATSVNDGQEEGDGNWMDGNLSREE